VIAWSPDGARLAIALEDGFAGVWDVATGAQRWRLVGHPQNITRIEWRRDGQRLLTSGEEGNGLIWDVAEPAR
jgi:WD40 repeat protein